MSRDATAPSLPWSEEAEKAVLSGILIDSNNNLPKISSIIHTRDFYLQNHRIVFSTFLEMQTCGIPIDILTLHESLSHEDEQKIGGVQWLAALTNNSSHAANFEYYAQIVKQKAIERRMLYALQNAQTAYLSGNGDIESAVQNLRTALEDAAPAVAPQSAVSNWRTVSCDNAEDWIGIAPVQWCCEQIIPTQSLGFIGGGPKDGKSVLMLDLMIHMAHAQFSPLGSIKFLNKFVVHGQKVLYISKEDGMERLYQRWPDINQAYGYTEPPPGLIIVPRKFSSFMLTEPSHIKWLTEQINRHESTFLTLDVFSELIPGIDEMTEIRHALTVLKDLRDELNISIAVIDHTRKAPVTNPKFKTNNQDLDPMEIRGAYKFGAADWTLMVGASTEANTLKISIRCKDSVESTQSFVLKRSPMGTTGKPKHEIESTIEQLAARSHEDGAANQVEVYAAVSNGWLRTAEIAAHVQGISQRTVRHHLDGLMRQGMIERQGRGRSIAYRRTQENPIIEGQQELYTDEEEHE